MSVRWAKQAGSILALALTVIPAHAEELTVSAASSLTNAFQEIASNYEARYPGSKILLNFGSSGAMLQQIAAGAPVDVFASADQETMDSAEKQNLIVQQSRRNFIRNELVVIVPTDGKQKLEKIDDLKQPAIERIAIGNPDSVPVGRYSKTALEAAGLWASVEPRAIYTQNVRQSLDYVARGEVDAGFVYSSDAKLMKDKVKVAFTAPLSVVVAYPIARTKDSGKTEEAKRFIDFLLSSDGQAVLERYGFLKP